MQASFYVMKQMCHEIFFFLSFLIKFTGYVLVMVSEMTAFYIDALGEDQDTVYNCVCTEFYDWPHK